MPVGNESEVHFVDAEVTANVAQVPTEPGREVDDSTSIAPSDKENASLSGKPEEDLTEAELRRLYEEEEIERFLGVFADYVNEVKLPQKFDRFSQGSHDDFCEPRDTELDTPSIELLGSDWLSIRSERIPNPLPPTLDNVDSISGRLALKHVLPVLPLPRPRPDRFTVGRFRVAIQRLYLVAHPTYASFFSRIVHLAAWRDKQTSGFYCCLFWLFWYQDLLMPAFFFRVLVTLLRRRLFAYPTVKELQARRREAALAEELGEEIQVRLGASSQSGFREAWRLFRVFSKPKRSQPKKTKRKIEGSDEKGVDKKGDEAHFGAGISSGNGKEDEGTERSLKPKDDSTILDDPKDSKAEGDFKLAMLNFLSDTADFHERIRNIVLWRNPTASRIYVVLLVCLIVLTTFLPTKYIIKTGIFVCGLLFWHVVPIIACLTPEDRERLPPLFDNAPTDAEYAMELISQRVSKGKTVKPARPPKKKKPPPGATERNEHASETGTSQNTTDAKNQRDNFKPRQDFDWRGLGEKAHAVQKWAGQSGLLGSKNKQDALTTETSSQSQGHDNEAHTYLAHYGAIPGTLSLSSNSLSFTPATSAKPKMRIAYEDIVGVKKIGMTAMPGLSIKWQKKTGTSTFNDIRKETNLLGSIEEKFWWVGGRDEVFAKLVGFGGGHKWMHV